MTEVDKKTGRDFIVFVDSNIIHTAEQEITLMPREFVALWTEISKPGDVTLMVPEIVLWELTHQKARNYIKLLSDACGKLKQLKKIMPLGIRVPQKSEELVRNTILKELESQIANIPACEVVSVQYDEITPDRLKKITENAVWRKPPFQEGSSEKGFRDSLILETVCCFHKYLKHNDVAFLTKDKRLREAAEKEFREVKNFGVYESLHEFRRYIETAREKFTPQFLHKVIRKAGRVFYDKETETGLFVTLDIKNRIIKDHRLKIGDLGTDPAEQTQPGGLLGLLGKSYKCATDPVITFGKTQFLSVVGDNNFHWITHLYVSAKYSNLPTLLTSEEEIVKERMLAMNVEWEAKVDKRSVFKDSKIIRIRRVEEVYFNIETNPTSTSN